MKIKKLELKKEIIASLTNEGMANVWGGDPDFKTRLDCPRPLSQEPRCYTLDVVDCPATAWNTCEDCLIKNTLTCEESTDKCMLQREECAAKTIICL